MWISENVRAVPVPVINAMQLNLTTIYLVGRGQVLTVDSGSDEERFRWMLKGYLAGQEKAEIGLSAVTHFHADHSSNLRWLRSEFGSEVLALREGAPLFDGRLPDTGVTLFEAGDEIAIGAELKLQVIPTPGHTPDSVSFYLEDEGVLFTGDTVLGGSNTLTHDLGAYVTSLQRILALPNLKLICPAHGELVRDPNGTITGTLSHYEEFERRVMAVFQKDEPLSSFDVAQRLYPNMERSRLGMAEVKTRSALLKLRNESRLTSTRGLRRSEAELAQEDADLKAQREAMEQAEKTYKDMVRLRIRTRGNPLEGQWVEPPLFSLS